MSRSKNSRKGATNKHSKRYHTCGDRAYPYCNRNKTAATQRRKDAARADQESA